MTKEITINDLDFFYMPNGLPCFLGNRVDIIDIVENTLNLNMYYLLADKATIKKYTQNKPSTWNSSTKTQEPATTVEYTEEEREACIFKVVKNMIGRVVQPADDCFGETYVGVQQEALYHLPPIPKTLVKKLDEFFRLVHAQHGTESIVLLTFDESNWSSDSWGVLVPKQENTSVHCKYDPDSVVELKPYHLSIVGSVHSHPEMSAYASGTDHEDQADFDGLHITYGWQKSKDNGATQYHIEMQMSGSAYILKPEDVFETDTSIKDPDPEVVAWTENVSKKAQPPYSATGVTVGQQSQLKTPAALQAPSTRPTGTNTQAYRNILTSISSDINLPPDAILVCEIDDNALTMYCPLCEYVLSNVDINNRMCGGCEVHLSIPSDNVNDIVGSVSYHESNKYLYGIKSTYSSVPDFSDVYLYCKDVKGSPMFLHIYSEGKVGVTESLDIETTLDSAEDYTLCCNTHIDDIATNCTCRVTVTNEDAIDFEEKHSNFDIYDQKSECFECANYMQVTCPMYRQIIVDWASDSIEITDNMIFDICDSYTSYIHAQDRESYIYDDDRPSLYYN